MLRTRFTEAFGYEDGGMKTGIWSVGLRQGPVNGRLAGPVVEQANS
jgi:hypothetical protein